MPRGWGKAIIAGAMLLLALPCAAQQRESRPWNLSLRTFGSYDSNIVLATTDNPFPAGSETNVFGFGAAGDYRLYRGSQWTVAATGHTCSHGASSHCMQGTGWKTTSGLPDGSPEK